MEFEGLCIMTADVPRLARFYRELFETTSEGDEVHTTLRIGALGLALWREGGIAGTDGERLRDVRKHCYSLIFSSPNVDGVYERAKELGAVIQEPPAEQPWGCRACVLNDPDGNRIDIVGKRPQARGRTP